MISKKKQDDIITARMVRMDAQLAGLSKATVNRMKSIYRLTGKELTAKLTRAKAATTKQRLELLLVENELMKKALTGTGTAAVVKAGEFSYERMNNILSWNGVVPGYKNVALSREQLIELTSKQKFGGKNFGDWIGAALEPRKDLLEAEIKTGIISGAGYDEITRILKTGSEKIDRDIETVVKTYIQGVNGKAQQDTFKANQDVVSMVEWSALLEVSSTSGKGTCVRCQALDGQKWPVKENSRPPCPLHARCRCMLYPVTKSWEELGIDISDEEITAALQKEGIQKDDFANQWKIDGAEGIDWGRVDNTFGEWYETMDPEYQVNAVGPYRAELLNKKLVKFEDFVVYDRKGLRAANKAARANYNRTYEYGDLIRIDDLATIHKFDIPTPPGTPGTKKTPKAGAEVGATEKGENISSPLAKTYFDSLDETVKTDYLAKFLTEDTDYLIVDCGNEGANYNSSTQFISMKLNKQGQKGQSSVFAHEYGHRTDHRFGEEFKTKWGDSPYEKWGTQYVSGSDKYHTAMIKDRTGIRNMLEDDFQKLGGTGVWTEGGLNLKKRVKFEEFKQSGFDNKIKPEYKPFMDLIEDLELEYDIHGDKGFLSMAKSAFADMRTTVYFSSEYDLITPLLTDYLASSQDVFFKYGGSNSFFLYFADAIGATSRNKVGFGHTIPYYNASQHREGAESFANIFLLMGNQKFRGLLEKFLPEQSKVFNEFLEVTTNR